MVTRMFLILRVWFWICECTDLISKSNFRSAVVFEESKQNRVGATTTDVIVNVDSTTSPLSGDVQVDVQVRIV